MIQIFSVIFKSQILFHYFKKRKVGLKMIRKLVQNYVAGMWHRRNLKTGSLKPGHSISHLHFIIVVQSLSRVQLFGTPWTAACQASLFVTIFQSLPKFMPIESVYNHLMLCHPLFLLPSIFPSIRVFSNELVFTLGGQSIGASASVLLMNIQD